MRPEFDALGHGSTQQLRQRLVQQRSSEHTFEDRAAAVDHNQVLVIGASGLTDKSVSQIVLPGPSPQQRSEHVGGMET
jgi:hypothetical protein